MRILPASAFFLALVSVFAFPVAAAELVVLQSTAAGLTPGKVVKSDAPIEVPAGASVTLVSESGKMVTLNGPHSGPPGIGAAGGGGDLVASLSGLLSGGKEKASLGVVRSAGKKEPPEDPWVIDTSKSGQHCVAAAGAVKLWRANGAKHGIVTLKNLDDKTKTSAEWPGGTNTLDWPAAVSRVEGARYLVGMKGSRAKKKFTLHLVPGDLPSDLHKAAWMAKKGCEAQAKRLLAGLR